MSTVFQKNNALQNWQSCGKNSNTQLVFNRHKFSFSCSTSRFFFKNVNLLQSNIKITAGKKTLRCKLSTNPFDNQTNVHFSLKQK